MVSNKRLNLFFVFASDTSTSSAPNPLSSTFAESSPSAIVFTQSQADPSSSASSTSAKSPHAADTPPAYFAPTLVTPPNSALVVHVDPPVVPSFIKYFQVLHTNVLANVQ